MDKVVLGSENIKNSLISAVRKGHLNEVRNLVNSYGLSYSEAWSEGYVLLVEAIKHRRTKVAKLLITKGAKVNSHHKEDPSTPLHYAVRNGNKKMVKLLLQRGANVHVKNTHGYTPLHCAVEKCSEEVVTLLLKSNVDVDMEATDGITPLHIAAEKGCVQIAEVLLNHGADIHSACTSTWKEGYMPIHFSSQKGRKEAVRLFLSKGADVNAKTKDDLTPLHLAIEAEHEIVIKLLLEHGANVDAQDKSGKTILHLAVEKGNATMVENVLKCRPDINNQSNRSTLKTAVCGSRESYNRIIENLLQYGFIVNPEDVDSPELLHNAVAKGSLKIVTDLLKYSADVNVKDVRGKTPIYYVTLNFDAEITKLLLTNGANIKDCPELLHAAVDAGCLEMIENLLKHGADVNMSDLDNSEHEIVDTPLHRAVEHMQEDVVKLLLKYGANVNVKDEWENLPIVFAVRNSDAKITKLLLTNGADIKDYPELLQIAAGKGCLEIVEDLLKYDADVNCSDQDGRTALYFTVLNQDLSESESSSPAIIDMHDREEIVQLLLRKGANVNAKTKKSITTLHTAARNGYSKIVEILLKFGADVDCRDKYGRTALYTAIKGGHMEVVKSLLEYGSDINITSKKNHTPLEYAMLGASLTYDEYDTIYGSDNYDYNYGYGNYDFDFDNYDDSDDYDDFDDFDDYDDYDDYHNYDKYFNDSDDSNFSVDDYHIDDVGGSDSDDNIRIFASRGKIVELLKQHIVKLKAASLYVSKKNVQSITTDYRMIAFRDECEGEIEIMKGEKIGNSYASFYDIMTKDTHQLALYAKNENIVQVFKSADYKTEFRIYAGMIEAKFRRGVERKDLMELGNQFFYSLFESLPELPLSCIENIFSYLSNNDLKHLHTCV